LARRWTVRVPFRVGSNNFMKLFLKFH